MQCRGCEPNLQSSLHGSARPSGSPSRHHQAMTPGSFPVKALAQGLAPDEYGHMKGKTSSQVPQESREPRPLGRKASFLTSHLNPSSNFPQFLSTVPSADIPVASPPLSRVPEHKRDLFKFSLLSHQNSRVSSPYLGTASSAFFLKELFWSLTPPSSPDCLLELPCTLAGSHFFPPHLSPRNPSLQPVGPWALRLLGPPHLFLYLVPIPLSPYGPLNPPPYPLSPFPPPTDSSRTPLTQRENALCP